MKKELVIKYVIDEDNKLSGSIIHKGGFKDDISSSHMIIGILYKLLSDEQAKLDSKFIIQSDVAIHNPRNEDGIQKE